MQHRVPNKLVASFDCNQGAVRAVRYNVDGNYCMTAGSDKSVRLWNPRRQLLLKIYTGCGSEVLDVAGSSDNSMILAGGRDKQPTIWDVESGKILKRWGYQGGPINSVAFNEDSTLALAASQDGTVNCHDVRSRGGPIQVLSEATDSILDVDCNAYEIATASADANVRLYDIREGRLFVDYMGESTTDVHLVADNQSLLVASMGGVVRLLEKTNGQLLADYTGHRNKEYRIECGVLSSNNEVVSGSEDGALYVWDMVDSKLVTKLKHPGARYIHSLSTHPSRPAILTAAQEKIHLWEHDEDNDDEEGDAGDG